MTMEIRLEAAVDQAARECIGQCRHCHEVCAHFATVYSFTAAESGTEPEHLQLILACSRICQTAADFLVGNAPYRHRVCATCAEICLACAASCERVGGLSECVAACLACAASCRRVATPATLVPECDIADCTDAAAWLHADCPGTVLDTGSAATHRRRRPCPAPPCPHHSPVR